MQLTWSRGCPYSEHHFPAPSSKGGRKDGVNQCLESGAVAAILQNNTGRRRAHLRGRLFSYHGLPATHSPYPASPPLLSAVLAKYAPSKQASQRAVSDPAQRQHQAALRFSLTLVFLAESQQLGPLNASLAGDKSAPLHAAITGRALFWRGRLHEQQHRRWRHCS